jgi:hypothetical protein
LNSKPSRSPTRASRSNHIVHETREAHDSIADLPTSSIAIGDNGTGDLLLVLDDDEIVWSDHETGEVRAGQRRRRAAPG